MLAVFSMFALVSCNESNTEKVDEPICAHEWDSGVEIKDASCVELGEMKYTCTKCESIKITSIEMTSHVYSLTWSVDDTYHWKSATCGCDIVADMGKHEWQIESESQATCMQAGSIVWQCADCLTQKTEVIESSHSFEDEYSVDDNYHWYASECGCDLVQGKHGHNWDTGVETPASCLDDGQILYTCEDCLHTKIVILPAQGYHVFDETKWAYDSENHYYASTCGCDVRKQETPHDWKNGVQTKDPSCTSYGEMTYTCECGAEKKEPIDMLRHTYSDEWTFDRISHWNAATCGCEDLRGNESQHTMKNGVCTICTLGEDTDGLSYSLSSDGSYYTVVGMGSANARIVYIPKTYLDKPVKAIENAFGYGSILEEIILPEGVTEIGVNAFMGATNLQYITIPSTVTIIGANAFKDCSSMKEIVLPENLDSIGENAFENCVSLKSINISNGVLSLGEKTFYGCTSLKEVNFVGVKNIGNEVFANCHLLTTLHMSDALETIGNYAFYNCKALTDISLPTSLKSIGVGAFKNCEKLTSVSIPQNVSVLEQEVFMNCTSLGSVELPSSLTSVGGYAFAYCLNISTFKVPENVTKIGDSAFYGCSKLSNITLSNIEEIADGTFGECIGLESINIPDTVKKIGVGAFANCVKLKELAISDSVTEILAGAFYNCSELNTVVIGTGIELIDFMAFDGCEKLQMIAYKGSEDDWKNVSIYGLPTTITITYNYVEEG